MFVVTDGNGSIQPAPGHPESDGGAAGLDGSAADGNGSIQPAPGHPLSMLCSSAI